MALSVSKKREKQKDDKSGRGSKSGRMEAILVETCAEGSVCVSGRGAGESLGKNLIKEFKQREA